jgi:hypothetical protein
MRKRRIDGLIIAQFLLGILLGSHLPENVPSLPFSIQHLKIFLLRNIELSEFIPRFINDSDHQSKEFIHIHLTAEDTSYYIINHNGNSRGVGAAANSPDFCGGRELGNGLKSLGRARAGDMQPLA